MPDDNQQLVTIRQLSWEEMCRKAWGKDWTKPDIAYEFSSGRKYNDTGALGGPYGPRVEGVEWEDTPDTWDAWDSWNLE